MSWAYLLDFLRPTAIGMVLLIAVHETWLARSRRGRLHGIVALWAASTFIALAARHLQYTTSSAAEAMLGARLQYAAVLALAPLAMLLALSVAPVSRTLLVRAVLIGGVALAGAPLLPWLDLHLAMLHDNSGVARWLPSVGAWTYLAIALLALQLGFVLHWIRSPRVEPIWRTATWLSGPVILASILHDALIADRIIDSVRILDVALVVEAVMLHYLLLRHNRAALADLERAVGVRTEQLANQKRDLTRALTSLRDLLQALPDTVFVYRDRRLSFVNPAGLRNFGYDEGELERFDIAQLIHETDREWGGRCLERIEASAEKVGPLELTFQRRDGVRFVGEVLGLQVEVDGAPAAVALIRDVTERRRMQAQIVLSDRLSSVGTLSAGIAHEINNPLAYVVANLEFAQDELDCRARGEVPLDNSLINELRALLRDAQDGADRVRRIVRDLSTFARSDDGGMGPVDIHELVELAVKLLGNSIRHRAQLERELSDVPLVHGNGPRLSQVLVNLLVNAVQAIPDDDLDGAHRIVVATRTVADNRVEITVRDTGVGVDPQIADRIFDPFFTTKPVGVGTGLGLSICHSIIASHGGVLVLEAAPGRGTVVRITLPAVPAAATRAVPMRQARLP